VAAEKTKKSETEKLEGILAYPFVGKIFFLAGIGGGLIAGIIYLVIKSPTITMGEAVLVVLGAPLLHGFSLLVYSEKQLQFIINRNLKRISFYRCAPGINIRGG